MKTKTKEELAILAILILGLTAVALFVFNIIGGQQEPTQLQGTLKQNTKQQFKEMVSQEGRWKAYTGLEADECYWVKSTSNASHHLLEVRLLNTSLGKNSGEISDQKRKCFGVPTKVIKVATKEPVNVQGSGCICGQDLCQFLTDKKKPRTDFDVLGCS